MQFEHHSLAHCAGVIVDNRGRTCPVGVDGIPLIATNCLRAGSLYPTLETVRFVAPSTYSTWFRGHPEPGDIIFVTKGSPGRVCLAPDPVGFCIAQDMVAIRADNNVVYQRYLFAVLRSAETQDAIEDLHVGTMIPHFKKGDFDKLMLPVPGRKAQEAIGDLHFELCERIEILNQSNATLEAIARALFKSWFVDFDPVRARAEGREPEGIDSQSAALFPGELEESELGLIPKGWRTGCLGELCQNIRVQAKPELLDASTSYIGLEHMPRRSIALTDSGTADGLASGKFWYDKNDVLFGKLRPYFHKVGVASSSGVCSTDILVIRAKDRSFFGYTTMLLSSDELIAYATQLSNGAKMPRSSWNDIANYKVIIPPEPLTEMFDELARDLIEKIHTNVGASISLRSLRDTLLPRLISGKLRLPEAEEMIEESVA